MSLLIAVHLLCVNVAAGGPLVAAWLDWRGSRDEAAGRAAKWLAGRSVAGLLAGAALGVLIGWLKWDADYRSLWTGPLSYKMHWAGIEAVFSLVLMIGWWLWTPGRAGGSAAASLIRGLLAFLASTNLLYHFPVLFFVAARLHDAGQTSGETIRGAAFRQLMIVDDAPAMAVHVTLASVAVAATMLLGLSLRWRRHSDEAGAYKVAVWGGRWALVATVLQLPVGLWALATMPRSSQAQIMGGSTLGFVLFLVSIAAALWLMRELVNVALGDGTRPALVRVMVLMLATVVLMTAMQQQTRGGASVSPERAAESTE
ncbi:MAG TPA: hypothetical protein VFV87_04965 [Pirellulaceae bacterium]|nr:hypothetical protein [Pirellulaceae bacterium]